MATVAKDFSVSQLEKLLYSRKSELDRLVRKREQLQRQLDQVQSRITSVQGNSTGSTVRFRTRRRPKNEKSLHTVVTEILTRNKKGLALTPLAEKVLESGYRTNSKDFKNVLYQCLYNSKAFTHDDQTGLYRLSK